MVVVPELAEIERRVREQFIFYTFTFVIRAFFRAFNISFLTSHAFWPSPPEVDCQQYYWFDTCIS